MYICIYIYIYIYIYVYMCIYMSFSGSTNRLRLLCMHACTLMSSTHTNKPMSHATPTNELFHSQTCSHTDTYMLSKRTHGRWVMSHLQTSHVTHTNLLAHRHIHLTNTHKRIIEPRHIHERVTCHAHEPAHTQAGEFHQHTQLDGWVMSHLRISHGTPTHESWHTQEPARTGAFHQHTQLDGWGMSHLRISRVTPSNVSRHTHEPIGWLRLVGFLKWEVSTANERSLI